MLFYKTLYFLKFYHCVHEIRTAYNFISCHDMYGISDKSDNIFNDELKVKLRQIILAEPAVMYVFGICTTFGITWIVQKLFGSYIWYGAGKIVQD